MTTTITEIATGTWTKWDDEWAVRLPFGALDNARGADGVTTVTVIKKNGEAKEVQILLAAEWSNDEVEIHHLVRNEHLSKTTKSYEDECRDMGFTVVKRHGVTYVY